MVSQGGSTVVGAKQLRATMKAAGLSLGDMTDVHRQVGAVVLPVAKGTSPAGSPKNGHIRSTVRVGATRAATILRAGNKSKPYAPPLHWGWFRKNIRPNPWLSRAAQSTEPAWSALYMQGVEKIIDKIKGM
jgi:hypothetical protein